MQIANRRSELYKCINGMLNGQLEINPLMPSRLYFFFGGAGPFPIEGVSALFGFNYYHLEITVLDANSVRGLDNAAARVRFQALACDRVEVANP